MQLSIIYGGNMAEKKKIPCRVCGKLFEPCAYCQSHANVFRWRNFACSRECATKYINDTIAYRESLKNKDDDKIVLDIENVDTASNENTSVEKTTTTRKKPNKRNSVNIVESDDVVNTFETETIETE